MRILAPSRMPPGGDGQALPEYALIIGLIAIVAIAALVFISDGIGWVLSTIGTSI